MESLEQTYVDTYNNWCRLNGHAVFAPILSHNCNVGCKLWSVPKSKSHPNLIAFVCTFSRKVHHCGSKCSHAQINRNSENYVCSLTGWVLPFSIEKNYVSISSDSKGNDVYTNTCNVIMGKTRKRPQKRIASQRTCSKQNVYACLKEIFDFKHSQCKRKLEKEGFFKKCATIVKLRPNTQHVNFLKTHKQFFTILKAQYPRLRSNFQSFASNEQLEKLSCTIISYFNKLDLGMSITHKTINTFTAVIVSKLRSGCNIGNITIFPKINWISKIAPQDVQFSGIKGIQCRSMSIMWRKIQAKIVCPISGVPSRDHIFSLTN